MKTQSQGLCIQKIVSEDISTTKVTNETDLFAFVTKRNVSTKRKYKDDYIIPPHKFLFIEQEDLDLTNIFISFEEDI